MIRVACVYGTSDVPRSSRSRSKRHPHAAFFREAQGLAVSSLGIGTYLGAMDDSTDLAKVKVRYVADAVAAALAGKGVEPAETPAVGCAVRYQRSRRTRESSR